ncbi:MAG: ABC transporter permease, partial [Chloroflexi bacterium]|nr:ABC transporter permease [Chloroflexota bacterium]
TGSAIRNAGQALEGTEATIPFIGDFLNSTLSMMGLVILIAAGFLIFNTFGMAITQRRQQIGALRSLGMTRRQIMRLVTVEATLTGGLGTLAGLLLGPLMGNGLLKLLANMADIAYGRSDFSMGSILLAITGGMGITLLATLIPARRATRISPLVALRAEQETRFLTKPRFLQLAIAGFFLSVTIFAYLLLNPPGAGIVTPPWDLVGTGLFSLGWLLALLLMMPFLLWLTATAVRRISRNATYRLMADNLERAQSRTILTIITLVVGLMMIVSVTGIITFTFRVVFGQVTSQYNVGWMIAPLPIQDNGDIVNMEVLSKWNPDEMIVSPEFISKLEPLVASRANMGLVVVADLPELAIMQGLPSYAFHPAELRRAQLFTFHEGDWETAQPLMESGCGLLLMPRIAAQHHVGLHDTLTLEGAHGLVECTVAGTGTSSFMGTTIISMSGMIALGQESDRVFAVIVQPYPNIDQDKLWSDLKTLTNKYDSVTLFETDSYFEDTQAIVGKIQVLLQGMLLLAIVAATLGVVNTTMMSISERRQELGLLRAVGATRRQVTAVVTGETALMGIVGGLVGLAAGIGLVIIFITVNGGNMWGLADLDMGSAMRMSLPSAFWSGLVGLAMAPIITGLAARWPVRLLLRGTAVDTLNPERQPETVRRKSPSQPTRHLYSLAWRNLQEHRLRTFLSGTAVALGTATLIAADFANNGILDLEAGGDNLLASFMDAMGIILQAIGVIILAAGAFLIFNAFAMTVAQRRRQLGLLRALGMTRRQVVRQLLAEAWLTGGAGTLLGLLAGPLLGSLILQFIKANDVEIGSGTTSISTILIAIIAGLGISTLSVLIPAKRAAKVSPLAALQEVGERKLAQQTPIIKRQSLIALGLILALTLYLA